jgi:hypothetical protein
VHRQVLRAARRALALLLVTRVAAAATPDPYAGAPAYLIPVQSRARIQPLVTVGQRLPHTGNPSETFRFVGIPDGLGLYAVRPDTAILLVNHEWPKDSGRAAGPLPAGARVTELRIAVGPKPQTAPRAHVVSGRWAIESVYTGEPPVRVDPVTGGMAKLCSAFLADERVGFDRRIFLNGEESAGKKNFDGRGGEAWALVGGRAYAIPRMGRAEWEDIVVAPFTGAQTVAFGLEDGPDEGDGLHSQLYMHLGTKQPGDADPLAANGLRGGALYALASDDAAHASEATFHVHGDSIHVHWVPVPWEGTDAGLDSAATAAHAFGFVRIEDGACDPVARGNLYFVTTGKLPRANQPPSCNERGRIYRLHFNPVDPMAGGTLTLLLDGSDGLVAPDNVDVNRHGELAIEEDPGHDMHALGLERDASIWIYDIAPRKLRRVAEMNRKPAVRHALAADPANRDEAKDDGPGLWESSGIVDAEAILGRGSWICDVQAHSLRIAPSDETVQGGQLLWLRTK